MDKDLFMRADEVAEVLGVSVAYAYKFIKKMNKEMEAKGYFTISGRLNREYFKEKLYQKQSE